MDLAFDRLRLKALEFAAGKEIEKNISNIDIMRVSKQQLDSFLLKKMSEFIQKSYDTGFETGTRIIEMAVTVGGMKFEKSKSKKTSLPRPTRKQIFEKYLELVDTERLYWISISKKLNEISTLFSYSVTTNDYNVRIDQITNALRKKIIQYMKRCIVTISQAGDFDGRDFQENKIIGGK